MYRIKTKGLVLRSSVYGEANKMLTVLTEESGKISVAARGGKSLKRGAFLNSFCYCEFELIKRGDVFGLESARPIENFFDISKSVENLFAASAITSFAAYICKEENDCKDMLRLCLNCLYALAKLNISPLKVMVVFYLKAAEKSGYAPEVNECVYCGEKENLSCFSPVAGGVVCQNCKNGEPTLSYTELEIMRFILKSDFKDMLKFKVEDNETKKLYSVIKLFIAEHFDYKIKDGGIIL